MGKGPGLYADIGMKARDLLFKDYQSDQKFKLATRSPSGAVVTATGTRKGEALSADISVALGSDATKLHLRLDTDSNMSLTVTADELLVGLRSVFVLNVPDRRTGKLELQYRNGFAGLITSVGLTGNPIVGCSGVVGTGAVRAGAAISYDTAMGRTVNREAGVSVSGGGLTASANLSGTGERISASFFVPLDVPERTALGFEATRTFTAEEVTMTAGVRCLWDRWTTLKACINTTGSARGLVQHEWRPGSLFTISAEVGPDNANRSPTFGLAVALKQ